MIIKPVVVSFFVGIMMCSTLTSADGLGVFAAYLDPSETDGVSGIGIRGRGGSDLMYFELRGTILDGIDEFAPGAKDELSLLPIDLGAGFHTDYEAPVQLYGGAGVTYYLLDVDRGSVDNTLGYYFQIGGEIELAANIGLFAEVLWRSVDSEVNAGPGLSATDLSIEGGAIHIGIMLRR